MMGWGRKQKLSTIDLRSCGLAAIKMSLTVNCIELFSNAKS